MRDPQEVSRSRHHQVSGRQEHGGDGGARQALQHKRAASLPGPHIQVVHLLRPLWVAAVGRLASRHAVRRVQNEFAQEVSKERGQQLWHKSKANSSPLAGAGRVRWTAA